MTRRSAQGERTRAQQSLGHVGLFSPQSQIPLPHEDTNEPFLQIALIVPGGSHVPFVMHFPVVA
jgi:hypothetical protein